jgi:alpha-tubulin suppressor-like RCC1 family protein
MRRTRRLGFSIIVALLLVGGLAACSQSEKAGILLNVSTDATVANPEAITSLWVTVDDKMRIYDLKGRALPGTLGIETSPGSKHIVVDGLNAGNRVLASGQVDVVAKGGTVVKPDVVLKAVPGDAGIGADSGPSGTGGASGFDGSPGSEVPASTGGGSGATGGVSTAGGSTSTGGVTSAGGLSNTGGSSPRDGALDASGGAPGLDAGSGSDAPATGGALTTGGATASGGSKSTGGVTSAGGATSTGGLSNTGGSSPTGGTTSAGGAQPTGGTTGTGGTTKLVATAVAAGWGHSCALINDGTIRCWGNNTTGALGNGDKSVDGNTIVISNFAVQVSGVTEAVSITTGGYHTCALLRSGQLQCWGKNEFGQLGDGRGGANVHSTIPANVINPDGTPLSNVLSVVGGTDHTCALLSDNTVKCWGNNQWNELGLGPSSTAMTSKTPVPVVTASGSPLSGMTTLAATHDHTCATQSSTATSPGPVYCWGYNSDGQLGTGNTQSTAVAVKVGTLQAVAVGAGGDHSCALGISTSGTVFNVQCWGTDSLGEIGAGPRDGTYDVFTPVHALVSANATMIALGWSHSCAVLVGGAIQCWGYNYYGQLGNGGNGDNSSSNVPVNVKTLSQVGSLSAGEYHTCAVNSGAVYCWGKNDFAQLGNAGTDSSVPVLVPGF